MHRQLASLLPSAHGDSHLVIVAVIDVRGFSAFSERVESVQAALFLRRVYLRLIDEYFADADFYKSTGDGLVVVSHVDEEKVLEQMEGCVRTCLKVVDDFRTFADEDPLINFDVPDTVGIGLARGAASRLHADETTIDYSGRTLNLASRLMDIARPEGMVIDGSFGLELLPQEIQDLFQSEEVYIRSVSERQARPIAVLAERTVISEASRRPIDEPRWNEVSRTYKTLRHLRDSGPNFQINLPEAPLPGGEMQVVLVHPAVGPGGRRQEGLVTNRRIAKDKWNYAEEGPQPYVTLNYERITQDLRDHGIRLGWGPLTLRILYRVP